jgi:hypothetical protein
MAEGSDGIASTRAARVPGIVATRPGPADVRGPHGPARVAPSAAQ